MCHSAATDFWCRMEAIHAIGRRLLNSLLPDRSGSAPGVDEGVEGVLQSWVVPETSSEEDEASDGEVDADDAGMDQAGPVVVQPRFRFQIHRQTVSYTNGSE